MGRKQEICGIVDGFAKSGMTRREYCEKHNIGIARWTTGAALKKGSRG